MLVNKSEEDLKKILLERILSSDLENKIYKKLLDEQIIRIMNEVFGFGNVLLETDKPLPFKSNFNETQEYLITATR